MTGGPRYRRGSPDGHRRVVTIVSLNSTVSCGTTPIARRRLSCGIDTVLTVDLDRAGIDIVEGET